MKKTCIKAALKATGQVLALLAAVVMLSCENKNKRSPAEQTQLLIEESLLQTQLAATTAEWTRVTEGKIVVVFGYGFNSDSFYETAVSRINSVFGTESGIPQDKYGLVVPLRFPDDFRNRIMNLATLIDSIDVKALILLGAPENTHYAIARIQDEWNNRIPYNIISLFPQDDVLGEEASCNIVIDYKRSSIDELFSEEIDQTPQTDIIPVLIKAVRYCAELPGTISADSELEPHAAAIAGKVERHTDVETGLQSVNHFVMTAGAE